MEALLVLEKYFSYKIIIQKIIDAILDTKNLHQL